MFSEQLFNSLHPRSHQHSLMSDQDNNNNAPIVTSTTGNNNNRSTSPLEKSKSKINEKNTQNVNADKKSIVKIADPKMESASGTQTLKRKRDSKPPPKIAESSTLDAGGKKQSQTTATILVSKTKTKSGLPLLLKK